MNLAAFLLLALCTITAVGAAESFSARVINVTDGDTITVLRDRQPEKLRLNGIDCPEKRQAFGHKAKELTASLVFGKDVQVQATGHDRYGRTIADVYYDNGHHLNYELVRQGLAWWYRKYSNDPNLTSLEEEARSARRGLWSEHSPVAPWDFRTQKREHVPTATTVH